MKEFMCEDFLLSNETAVRLYHDYAKVMPIYDYHCHLSAKDIAEDRKYYDITEVWLAGDHYKWRAMRSNGVEEKYITGSASHWEKFLKWAETMQSLIGNPLYHWTHLELKRYFGISKTLTSKTAGEIWEQVNQMLNTDQFTVRSLIKRANVKAICTTDDPADTLEYHFALRNNPEFDVKVKPTFRPDKAVNIEKEGFVDWVSRLGSIVGKEINNLDALLQALESRMDYFEKVDCSISDHSLEPVCYREGTKKEVDAIFIKALSGDSLLPEEVEKFKTMVMIFLGKQYAKRGWVMQLHIGALRNSSLRMFRLLGADAGFDTMADYPFIAPLAAYLGKLDETNELPKTILYCLNPCANEALAALAGCYQSGGIPGKIQFGSGWWFNDQKDGMNRQITALSSLGLLSRFVGMLTDSRSFLSFTRHEYFRRILCNILGSWVENGEAPNDISLIGEMVKDICFNNAEHYFGI